MSEPLAQINETLFEERYVDLTEAVVGRVAFFDMIFRRTTALTPRTVFRELLWLQEARRRARLAGMPVSVDGLDVVQRAFWLLCPPEDR